MTPPAAHHWTTLDAALTWFEAAGVWALMICVPWVWDRARKPRQPTPQPLTGVAIHARDTTPYDSPAYSTGGPGEEPQ